MTLRERLDELNDDYLVRVGCKKTRNTRQASGFFFGGRVADLKSQVNEIDESNATRLRDSVRRSAEALSWRNDLEFDDGINALLEKITKYDTRKSIMDCKVLEEYESICGDAPVILIEGDIPGRIDTVIPMEPLAEISDKGAYELTEAIFAKPLKDLTQAFYEIYKHDLTPGRIAMWEGDKDDIKGMMQKYASKRRKGLVNTCVKNLKNVLAAYATDSADKPDDDLGLVRRCMQDARERLEKEKKEEEEKKNGR